MKIGCKLDNHKNNEILVLLKNESIDDRNSVFENIPKVDVSTKSILFWFIEFKFWVEMKYSWFENNRGKFDFLGSYDIY